MRNILFAFVAVTIAGFIAPPTASAQFMGEKEGTVDYLLASREHKRKKKQMQLIVYGVLGVIGCGLITFIALNMAEKRAARRALMEKLAERQAAGLM